MKKFYVGVKAIIVDRDKGILLLKHAKGFWDVPGGRIDENETIQQTLAREISEELPGAKLEHIKKLESAFRLQKDIDEDVSLVLLYHTVNVVLPSQIVLSDEHTEYLWVNDIRAIPDLSWNQEVQSIIKNTLK